MYEEELRERNIYFFKPDNLNDISVVGHNDYDTISWSYSRLLTINE